MTQVLPLIISRLRSLGHPPALSSRHLAETMRQFKPVRSHASQFRVGQVTREETFLLH